MPFHPVPINEPPYRNVDSESLIFSADALIDGYIDEKGASIKRAGVSSWIDLGLATGVYITGTYWWKEMSMFIVTTSTGKVYKITSSTATTATDITGDGLETDGTRPTFATDGSVLIMANGGKMIYTNGTANTAYIADAQAPTAVSHVAFFDQYIIANKVGTADVQFSNVGDYSNWDAIDFFSNEGGPDDTLAVHVTTDKIYAVGENTIEVYYNDGSTPFSRVGGGLIHSGTIAKYSTIVINNILYYLDQNRQMVGLNGTVPQIISLPFDRDIQAMSTVDDCMTDYVMTDGKKFLVLHFPTENVTYVYDFISKAWSQWGYWNQYLLGTGVFSSQYDRWIANAYAYAPEWGFHLVGSRIDSKIHKMSRSYYTDNGNNIRFLRRSGHFNHGTHQKKRSKKLIMRAKSGKVSGVTDPVFMIRWKDNNKNIWSNEHWISLGNVGVTEFIKTLYRMGAYQTRQYEIVQSDPVPFTLTGMEEEVEILRT